jgi:2-polyprenyl-6-hydroxyphenyl methylase/3-demethylubiquinone-9 3-methyltransferase
MAPKNTICLWYDGTALDAAEFYARTFPDSVVGGGGGAAGGGTGTCRSGSAT